MRLKLPDADSAILDARQGRKSTHAMLKSILAAQVAVPLAEPPLMNGTSVQSWKPAKITKQTDGGQFLTVFTNEAAMTAFSNANPEYSHYLWVDAQWVLDRLQPHHGIVFNLGTENGFEWSAEGIAAFKAAHSA
jgi:hypothetical protein